MTTSTVHFTKMHGAGNDYIYVDSSLYDIPDPADTARVWSHPHTGIGSDGLVLIGRSPLPEADFTMRIFNADGSEAMMCGNASRCIGKYVYEHGLTHSKQIRLLTLSGIKMLDLHVDADTDTVETVTVDMLEPALSSASQLTIPELIDGELTVGSSTLHGTFVSMGNPHCVIFVDSLKNIDVASLGSQLEHHPLFPERCNIEFAEMRPDGILMRVWERGSGITCACGTGACATAVAAAVTGRAGRRSTVIMDGGQLDIEWRKSDGHVYMTGTATFVFEGDVKL